MLFGVGVAAPQTIDFHQALKQILAQAGQEIAGNKATVGGVLTPCHSIFVGRTLTQQEQTIYRIVQYVVTAGTLIHVFFHI